MGGKSTYMRQIALITLLAHTGSFVPAESATIGSIDRIFTRMGSSDDLAGGRSTFMVEMTETAHILNQATPNSLVLMDEVGRGTSTFDGLSLAWSAAQHLASHLRSLTLFATHYFELTQLADHTETVTNVHLSATEHEEQLIFLHKVQPGAANQSYGLQVAKLAGVPTQVIEQARSKLNELEQIEVSKQQSLEKQSLPQETSNAMHSAESIEKRRNINTSPIAPNSSLSKRNESPMQVDLFLSSQSDQILEKINTLNLDNTTPKEALDLLYSIKNDLN